MNYIQLTTALHNARQHLSEQELRSLAGIVLHWANGEDDFSRCPNCGGTNLEETDRSTSQSDHYVETFCHECGTRWSDQLVLKERVYL